MTKTLIFNGSPRKKGVTAQLIERLISQVGGEVMVVESYQADIKPCVDCRYCFTNKGCCMKDDMQDVYSYIEECDHIILAAPIYFGEISGQLLAILSRLQTYFSAKYIRKEEPIPKTKTGGIFLAAGSFGPREKAEDTAKFILEQMSTTSVGTVYINDTDKIAIEESRVLEEVDELAKSLKQGRE